MKLALKLMPVPLLLCSLVAGIYGVSNNPEVQTPLGLIKGSLMSTRLNRTIYAFRGIRYGKSPDGNRRFKVAEPVDPWSGVFDASKEGPCCPRAFEVPPTSSEDCLRLNVYTTKLPDRKTKVKRPVIVFFHPGGFWGFSGQSKTFGPQYFLDQDIVLVVVNYRLALLGFIATGDARAPGNLGLKDQVYALRWIQKNIAAFGGDPDSVTITGCSAGAWSVIFHMLSPMSRGLFHRAISLSGSPTVPDLLPTEQTHLVYKQARFANCSYTNIDTAIECLKEVPMEEYRDSLPKFWEWYGDPILVWSPVVEPEVPGVERFLTAQPVDLIRLRQFQHVPLVIGITKDEFASAPLRAYEQALNGNDSIIRNVTEKWYHAAPISFQYQRDTPRSKYISRELYKFYLKDQPINVENMYNLGLIYADAHIGFEVHRTAMLFAEYSKAPVYHYMFTYQGRYSFGVWADTKKPYGVIHQDDLQYLFYMSFGFPFFKKGDPETAMVDKYTAMYANFAKTGYPIPKNNRLFKGVTWPVLNPKEENYLEIGEHFIIKCKMYPERYALWNRLFPLQPIPSRRVEV